MLRKNLISTIAMLAVLCGTTAALADQHAAGESGAKKLTGPEMEAQADKFIETMKKIAKQVADSAAKARESQDFVKLVGINGKLILIKGNLRTAEQLRKSLKSAVLRRDTKAAEHDFSLITIAYQKVLVLKQEADATVGEELAYLGDTQVTLTRRGGDGVFGDATVAGGPPSFFGGGFTQRTPVGSGKQ